MPEWIDKHVGAEVEIHCLGEGSHRDKGDITDAGDGLIELTKKGNEMMIIPTSAIRLAKVLSPVKSSSSNLLRPAGSQVEVDI